MRQHMRERLQFHRWWALWLLLAGAAVFAADAPPPSLTVFGAASLTNALQDLGDSFTKQSAIPVKFSFAASSVLARQIESGARADIFFSADLEWMDYLQSRGLIDRASRHDVLGNRLVLIAPADSKIALKIAANFPLAAALGNGRLATGDPDSVPAGRYARSALSTLGVWNDVADRIVRAESVRSALMFVDRGEVPLGIVYETDALIDPKVRVVDFFPANSHLPITYPIALTSSAKPDAQKFLDFIRGPAGEAVFKKYGFISLH
jgi:molybdate transport system substrate-binding protein